MAQNLGSMSDEEWAKVTGKNPEFRTKDRSHELSPQRRGIIPGLSKLAGGVSNIFDLFHGAKKLARAEDTRAAQSAIDSIASMDKSKTV
jgi:hypothetical protein